MLNSREHAPAWRWIVVGALYLAGVALTVVYGTLHNTDTFLFDYDARFWHLGGVMWLRGESPYAHAPFLELWIRTFGEPPRFRAGFVYPGTILPLSLLLGAFPWNVARWIMRGINFAAYFGALLALRRMGAGSPTPSRPRAEFWIAAAAAVPGAALTMFQGQMSLLVTLGICLLWAGLRGGRALPIVAGLFLASMKPQVALVATLFLLCCFRDRRAWLGLALAGLVSALVLLWTTPAGFLADLRGSLTEHTAQEFNSPDNYDSLIARLGTTGIGRVAQWGGVLGGCGAAAWLGMRARRAASSFPGMDARFLQIALAITAVVMPVHRYDLAVEMPLVAACWALGSNWRAGALFALVLAHGQATWLCWHLEHRLGIPIDYHTVAGYLAAAELLLLLFWWQVDARQVNSLPLRGDTFTAAGLSPGREARTH